MIKDNNGKLGIIDLDKKSPKLTYLKNHDDYFNEEVADLYKRECDNAGHLFLNEMQKKYFCFFNDAIKNQKDEKLLKKWKEVEFDYFFKELENEITIENEKQIKELMNIFEISSIFFEEALEEKNQDLFLESVFQIKSRIENSKIIKKHLKIKEEDKTAFIQEDKIILEKNDNDDMMKQTSTIVALNL